MNDFKLDSRPNIKSGFKAPDSYFESLTDRVMLNLPMEGVKVIPLYRRRPVWVTSAAAALVLSLSLVLSKNDVVAPAMPDEAASKDYILNNASTYEIAANLNTQDIQDLAEQSLTISDEVIEEIADFDDVYYQTN
jgi:hypothetical protein